MSGADHTQNEVVPPFCDEHVVMAADLESGVSVGSDDLRTACECTTACEDARPDCPFRFTIQTAAARRGIKTG